MKDMIILKKIKKKEELLKNIIDINLLVEVTWVSNLNNLIKRYKWAINNVNTNKSKKLGLTRTNKY